MKVQNLVKNFKFRNEPIEICGLIHRLYICSTHVIHTVTLMDRVKCYAAGA